jgi:hypothetical protein
MFTSLLPCTAGSAHAAPICSAEGLLHRRALGVCLPAPRRVLVWCLPFRFTEGELGRPVSEKEFAAMLKEDYGDLSADVKPLSEYADAPRPQQQQPQQAAAGPRRIAPMPAGEGMAPPPAAAAARADSGGLGMGAGAGLPPGASALDSRLMPQGAAATTTLVSHHPHTPSRYCCRAVLLAALCVFGTRDAVAFASMGHRPSWVA